MAGLFHDTFFALIVRAVFGSSYFPHQDEITPPDIYERAIRKKASSETTLGPTIEDHDDPMNARGRGYGAYDEQEAHATDSATPPSALTVVTPEEFPKASKEEGMDPMLVTWHGPDDPEVCRGCQLFHTPN